MENYYSLTKEECLKSVNSVENGLSKEEAEFRLKENGKNKIETAKKKNVFAMFFKQFLDIMIIVLIIAGGISTAFAIINNSTSEMVDAIIIFAIVILNGVIGFVQELKAEKSLQNLKCLTVSEAKVIRNGELVKISSELLVVGDIVMLEAGDIVPADLRLIESVHLKSDESSLTGESQNIDKIIDVLDKNTALADRKNMVYKGTNITNGRGIGVVVAVGMATEMGKIASLLKEKEKPELTPIQKSLKGLGIILTIVAAAIAVVMFIVEAVKPDANYIEAFMTAVAVAVAAIPESLPAVVTIIMAIGVSKLAKKKAIVKNLNSVETLGCCEVICSDKTGTLTENKMTVDAVYDNNNLFNNSKIEKLSKELELCLKVMALCNSCAVGNKVVIGDPTEVALCEYANLQGFNKNELKESYVLVDEIPFDSNRKLMTTIFENNGKTISLTKGGLDEVLSKCSHISIDGKEVLLDSKQKKKIISVGEDMASKALRVLGFAVGTGEENNLTFVGLSGMIDPPRKEAFEAVEKCFKAGMVPIMITGDHKDTAFEIAKKLGIAKHKNEVMLGVELDKLSEEEFIKKIYKIKVYARVTPENKVRIVQTYKKLGKVVAMTGDGVNDAPCIKTANIGIGMGITGTDVSKESADIIVADDNFATIVIAIEEGRRIYKNIEKTVKFLLASNGAEMISILLISLIFPSAAFLLPVHILFINLITDSFPSIALGFEPPEFDIMSNSPRNSKKHILSGLNGIYVILFSVFQAAIIIGVYILGLYLFGELEARSMAFYTFNIVQLFYIVSARVENYAFKSRLLKNKWIIASLLFSVGLIVIIAFTPLNQILHLVNIGWQGWLICLGLSSVIFPIGELYKFVSKKMSKKVGKNR